MTIALLFIVFLGLLLIGAPISSSIGLALIVESGVTGDFSLNYIGRGLVSALDSFPVLAVPIFIFAGEIMAQGGISKRLFNFANSCVGRFTGGVPMATILTCMLFGAISGSGSATFAAVGTIMIPIMAAQGYDKNFITALTASSGGLGTLIPPSLPMVMYAVAAGLSVNDMFMSGIIPGVLCGIALMVYAYIFCRKNPVKVDESIAPRMPVLVSLRKGALALLCPVIILGGIYAGVFTATEAAAVAALYGLIVSIFIYKTLAFKDIPRLLLKCASQVAPILLIVAAATVLGRVLTLEKVPKIISDAVLSATNSKFLILLAMNIILLIAGMLMEALAATLILTPIFLPIASGIGVDPIHLGVIIVANLAIGFVTPPVGTNLYIASGLTGIPIKDIFKHAIGPIIALLIAQVLIVCIPQLSTWLPSLLP